ncbi:Predicted epimerase, PhzC/PhzF homolog [Mycolicibacterium phlei]|uniref:PhzF family phenazine biosynthesis protein n=1 Tax=Mycobacteroides chelonae TaxID=1774 RepID=UPI000618B869|nr:PhzF family phenazine biosynthesis protein [Mycobacteroides chelonae]VEG15799.1 Predicted epimerase, PhzC/PhzF homolog [Mycolicibacterium phlei]AKC38481.1 hypothetical protein GR01_07790 [Mycobacteroides chelonae]ANB00878.1 hypothetical protein BB28_08270 [Mycobacteroides chelonae CCUG 47445]OLT75153.1 hypothetical protein BKG56_15365 [Mycobacteroides chelonae]ORV12801.1 hypothetical protein AWB96_15605 [Mycobacteroides chelonae]
MIAGSAARPLWWGRVFVDGVVGGNHTVVLNPGAVTDPAVAAQRLGVPDTAVVVSSDERGVLLRTFSPVEELGQCVQTSLASIVALDLPSGRSHDVRHLTTEPLQVEREGDLVWAHSGSTDADSHEEASTTPRWLVEQIGHADAVRVGGTRPRLLVRCDDINALSGAVVPAVAVRNLCTESRLNGLVIFGVHEAGVRVRVFTTSLAGAEDTATGGAVMSVASLLRREGVRAEIAVRQGGTDLTQHGHLRLRIDDRIALGGAVLTLARGRAVDS